MDASPDQRRLRRDIGWNLVPVALLAGVGLGLNFLIGAWWGAGALGAFSLVTIALFSLAVVGAGGLQYAVLRAVAEQPDDRDRVAAVVAGALIPNLALAAAATGLFVALHRPIGALVHNDAVARGMLWAAPGLFCFAINKVLLGVVNGLRRMRAFAIYTSLRYLLIAGGLLLARALRVDAHQLPAIWTLAEAGLLIVLAVELVATVSLSRARGAWRAWARRHLDYGARGVLATLAYEVNSKLDVWMVGVAMPDTLVGVYSLASSINEGAMQLAVVLQNNVNPVLARQLAVGDHAATIQLVRRTRRWFVPAMFAAAAAGAALYPQLIPWLIGDRAFAAGALPFAIMLLGVALASPYLPFIQLLLMAGRPGWHTAYVLAIVAVNFLGNLALIPLLGLAGAAAGMASSIVASALLLRWLARRRVGVAL